MKKINKIVYSILFVLTCFLVFDVPVFADSAGIVSHYNLNSDTGEQVTRLDYAISDCSTSSTPFAVEYPDSTKGFYISAFVEDKATAKLATTYTSVSGGNTTVNYRDFGKTNTALYWFKNKTIDGLSDYTNKSWYVYLVGLGYETAELDKVLAKFYILNPYGNMSVDRYDSKVAFSSSNLYTISELFEYMKSLLDKGKKPWEDKKNDGPPKFYLKTHNDNGLNKYTEYTLTWLTKGSFVEGKESEYGFKVFIGKERKPLEAKDLEATKYSPCKFTADKFVFTWENVKDLFSFLSTSSLENRFDVFIQITDKTGKAVSDNYIHFLVIKRVEIRESDYVDKNGNIIISYGKWENGQFKYTDGRDTSSEDNSTNSNGSSTAPGSNVSNDDYTDISNAPSSSQIDASATSSLIKTLDTIVSSVSNVPALLAKVYAWLPYQIITLIGTAIGLIVVVGIIKWVL